MERACDNDAMMNPPGLEPARETLTERGLRVVSVGASTALARREPPMRLRTMRFILIALVVSSRPGVGQNVIATEASGPEGAPRVVFSPGTMLDRTLWRGQVALRDSFRVVRFDPRGLGVTPAAESEFDPREDLRVLLESDGPGPACVVAQSGGAIPVLDLLVESPPSATAAVLVAPGVSGFIPPASEIARFTELATVLQTEGHEAGVDFLMGDPYYAVLNRNEELRELVRGVYLANPRMWISGLQAAQAAEPALPRLASVYTPTLVVVGSEDVEHMRELSREIASQLPNARLEIVEGAGHLLPLERPTELNALLRDFLGQHCR